ncbi:MAG: hypothetical protein JWN93_3201 [Hyphomicrobiales bacterium]|nr:hypothetical protein [Hyphomicrobiales bacterium]
MTRAKQATKAQASAGNPKTEGTGAGSNRIKDPQDWVTGDEPMTGAQASYLKTLAEQTQRAEAFDPDLHKAEASQRIEELKQERDQE